MKNISIAQLFVILIFFVSFSYSQALYKAERADSNHFNPDNPDSHESSVAINNNGLLLGHRRINTSIYDGFTYSPPYLLGGMSGGPSHILINDINDNGNIVGACRTSNSLVDFVPCQWVSQSTSLGGPLGLINGYANGSAFGINNSGKIVGAFIHGTIQSSEDYPDAAFIWDAEDGYSLLGTLNGGSSRANSINDAGKVVGESDNQAFIWDAQNGMRPLSVVIGNNNGWVFKTALKINNNGHVIGIGEHNSVETNFYWDGTYVFDVGQPNDSNTVYRIFGLNDLGQIAGYYFGDNQDLHGFIWNIEDGFQDVNNLVSEEDWVWRRAWDINNQGEIAVDGFSQQLDIQRAWILSPKEKEPVIFIPGVGGSTLDEIDSNGNSIENLWMDGIYDRTGALLGKLSLDPNYSPPSIKAKDITYENGLPVLSDIYGGFLSDLETRGSFTKSVGCSPSQANDPNKPDLFLLPYDWRHSNELVADELNDLMECVKIIHPGKKVNIVTHSMGGLIARRYVVKYPQHNVDKMITLVAPWLGAPKAINALFTGEFLPFSIHKDAIKDVVRYGAGPHELLPTWAYFSNGYRPFYYKDTNTSDFQPYAYSTTVGKINGIFQAKPYTNNEVFHLYKAAQDDWSYDDSGIKYYHLHSIRKCKETIGKVSVSPDWDGEIEINSIRYKVETEKTDGDGTVPTVSADRPSDMLAPNTVVVPFENVTSSILPCGLIDMDYTHNGILGNSDLRTTVWEILNDTFDESEWRSRNSANLGENTEEVRNFVKITGVDRLEIIDEQDNTNTSLGFVDKPVPNVSYRQGSVANEEFIYPHEVSFTFSNSSTITPYQYLDIKFTSTTETIQIQLLEGTEWENSTKAVKYLDLHLPVGVNAWIRLTPGAAQNLRYDADGDGIYETEVQPTLTLNNTDANDKTAPQISASYTLNNGAANVTINAVDNETGIKNIRYLVYGENSDQIYTTPFTVNTAQSKLLYIAAEDNAGNKNLITKWIDDAAPTTTISQTPPANAAGWNTSNVTVGLSAIDDVGSSGINTLSYSASGAQYMAQETLTKEVPVFSLPRPSTSTDLLTKNLTFFSEGVTIVSYYSADNAGNSAEEGTYTVKIDKSDPISQHVAVNNGQQTLITLNAVDNVSGISEVVYSVDGAAAQVYSTPFSVSNTGGHSITYYAKDIAGNEELPHTIYINPENTPKSVLIDEFRTRGYLGADDEFIELYNNGDVPVDIGGWSINIKHGNASTPTVLATINSGTIIPARGHYLLRKDGSANYSLSSYGEADATYTGSMGDNVGIALISNTSVKIDSVGFSSVTDVNYKEGTALAPSTGISTNGQYSFIRNYTNRGLPIDTNNNRTDFIFVAVDGGTYNNLKAVLGSPGPENLSSPVFQGGNVLISQVDDSVTLAEDPNRVYDYSATSSQYPVGTLSIRRRLVNNTGKTITALRVRITGITTKNSSLIFPQQAVLRVTNSNDFVPEQPQFSSLGNIPLKGLTIEGMPALVDGGLNSSLTLNLGTNGLGDGNSLNIDLKTGIVTNGQYKLEFRVEVVTSEP